MRRAIATIGRRAALSSSSSTTAVLRQPVRGFHDVVVCGGGVVGSSVALHLKARRPDLSVTVLERDQTYARASAPLSAGGIRQQFTTPANVQLSCYGAHFLRENFLWQFFDDDESTMTSMFSVPRVFLAMCASTRDPGGRRAHRRRTVRV